MARGAALALRTGAVIAFSVALAVLLSVVLANLNFERTLREVTASRFAVAADDVRRHIELGLTLGLDLAELADVQALADRAAAGSGILGIEVVDDRGAILFAADRAAIGRSSSIAWNTDTDAAAVQRRVEGDTLFLGADLRNSFGQVVGAVVMRASLAELRTKVEAVRHGLAGGTLALVAAAGLAALAAVFATLRLTGARAAEGADGVRPLVLRLTVVTVTVLLLAAGGASWLSLRSFDAVFQPELARKSATVGTQLAAQIDRALCYGIPLDRMPGLEPLFREEAARHADIAYLAVADPRGRVLAAAGTPAAAGLPAAGFIDTALPLKAGSLHVGVDAAYLAKASTGLMLDVLSVVLVAVLLMFEVLLLVVHRSLGRVAGRVPAQRTPDTAQERPFNLVCLRLPVFLFCLSEELSRPFLPAYSKSFAAAVPWLTPDLVVGLPITLFMLIWAMSQPGGARVSERWGRGRAFLAGALLGAASLAMTAYAGSLGELLLWRCLTALGYGLVLITAQGIVVDHTTPRNRAGGMAAYIGALLAAGVCGPVTGGIIADQAGIEATFLLGSALALGSGLTLTVLLRGAGASAVGAARTPLGAGWPLLRNLRFAALMLFSAIPTKIAATALLFCLVPLLLTADGASKTEVGRVQMMYFVAFVLVSPLAAGLSDRWQARRGFIALGGLGTLAACLPLLLSGAWWAAPLGVGLFGLFQALVGAPQLTLVSQIARDGGLPETAAIGWYRMIERLGAALGPVIALWVAVVWSYREAMLAVGLLCGASAVLFWLVDRAVPARRLPTPMAQEA